MKKVVITGAAGFIGSNLALFLKNDFNLVLLDNLSRTGSETNRELLLNNHQLKRPQFIELETTLPQYNYLF